jgi:Tfp pilus assembly protein PilN
MNWKKGIQFAQSGTLLSVEIQSDGFVLHACSFQVPTKNKTFSFQKVEDLDTLVKDFGVRKPFYIQVSGNGVLTRLVENAPQYKEQLLVSGNVDDFYFSSYETKGTVGVSFVRKSVIESLISFLESKKAHLLGIHIGPILFASSLSKQSYKGEFNISFEGESLVLLEKNQNTHSKEHFLDRLCSESVLNQLIYPVEGYYQAILPEAFAESKAKFKEQTTFERLGIGVLTFFLLSLSANYFYVNHLNQIAAEKEVELSSYGQQLSLIDRLNQEKNRKIQLFESSGLQSNEFISFYLDELGKSVPSTITLTILETFPLKEGLKPRKKVEIDRETIAVSGLCNTSKTLDDWMEKMERFSWIKSVELINYLRQEDGTSFFQLKIKLNK